jgi:methionyl-tRNA formyltransferase
LGKQRITTPESFNPEAGYVIRVVFFGSPEFAVPSLVALDEDPDFEVALVVTQPDRRAGRGRKLLPPAVKVAAEERSLPLIQPETLRNQSVLADLEHLRADFFLVVSFGEILRRRVLNMPRHGCLNVHPSLLPRYRGATPIPAAILNGDQETGVSIMRMVRRLDAGPVLAQRPVSLDGSETTGSLTADLSEIAAEMLVETAIGWVTGTIVEQPQDDAEATYTRELRKSDAQVDWTTSAIEIERFVRAMEPWPRAWTVLEGQRVSLHRVAYVEGDVSNAEPGDIIRDENRVLVATSQGMIGLQQIQPAGKKIVSADGWYRGLKKPDSLRFDSRTQPLPPLIERR